MCHRVSSAAATPTPGRAWVSALVVSETASEFRVVSWCWVMRLMEGIEICVCIPWVVQDFVRQQYGSSLELRT